MRTVKTNICHKSFLRHNLPFLRWLIAVVEVLSAATLPSQLALVTWSKGSEPQHSNLIMLQLLDSRNCKRSKDVHDLFTLKNGVKMYKISPRARFWWGECANAKFEWSGNCVGRLLVLYYVSETWCRQTRLSNKNEFSCDVSHYAIASQVRSCLVTAQNYFQTCGARSQTTANEYVIRGLH